MALSRQALAIHNPHYEVTVKSEGRGGWAYYVEDGYKLPFDWDVTPVGFDVYLPTPEEWFSFCDKHGAVGAKGRRPEIVQRLAEGVRQKRAKSAKVSIDDSGISYSFKGGWLYSLLNKILGNS